jgi:hypothetical protein
MLNDILRGAERTHEGAGPRRRCRELVGAREEVEARVKEIRKLKRRLRSLEAQLEARQGPQA